MSLQIKIYNQSAEPISDLELSAKIFGVTPKSELLHQAMIAQMNNSRQVLAHTKDRSEVSGGGKKPWKQKGTGRARAGSSRSPIWIGGGVTFGPRNDRNFKQKINQKMKQKAIFMVLSDRYNNKGLVVLDNFNLETYKTKQLNQIITDLETKVLETKRRNILIVNDAKNDKVKYSGRNLVGVKIINLENLNLVDLLNHRNLVITTQGVEKLTKLYSK